MNKEESRETTHLIITDEIYQQLELMHTIIYSVKEAGHALNDEQKKFREAFSQIYNYFHAIDRTIDGINKRVQMLELRMAKESDGGHA